MIKIWRPIVLVLVGMLALTACEKSPYKNEPAKAGQAGGDGGSQ